MRSLASVLSPLGCFGTRRFGRTAGACLLLVAIAGGTARAQSSAADASYARFLQGLTATEVVRSRMAQTPNARIIAVLAGLSEVAARNRNATAAQLSAFVAAYDAQLRTIYAGDPNLVGGFAVQPAVRFLTRVTSVQGLDTDIGESVTSTLGLSAEEPNRQLNIIGFQNGTIPALATGDAVAVMLNKVFSGLDAWGGVNPLVESQAAAYLRSQGIEPYPSAATLSAQYPEIVSALALMPQTAAAFDAERAAGFGTLRAAINAEFDAVTGFVSGKLTTLGTLAVTYPTLASTQDAAANATIVSSAENARLADLVALNRSRARLSFATKALENGTFAQATEGNALRTYANIKIRLADATSSAANTGLVIGGSVLSGIGQAAASPNKVGGFMQAVGALGFGSGLLMGNVRNHDVRPSPFQQLSNQITVLQNQTEQLRFQMTNRFDRVDAGLQAVYTSINGGFAAMTSYFVDTTVNLQNIQTQLALTQTNLNRFEQNLYGILASGFNFPFVANMETAIGYRDRTGSDLTYSQFNSYEGGFYSAAVNDAASAVFAGSDTPLTYDTAGSNQIDNYPLGYNLNALRTFPATFGQAALGTLHAANPTTWALNADVYAQFSRENPWYSAKILSTTPSRIGTVLSAGQNSQSVMNAAKRQALFDRLLSDHASRSTTLQAAIDPVRNAQLAGSSTPQLNPWGGPAQVVPAPAGSGRMSRYGSTDGSGLVTLPFSGGSTMWNFLPANDFRTAMYMSLPQRTNGYYSWTYVRTGTWVPAGTAPVDPFDPTLGTFPLSSCSYEVQLWWNPSQVGGVNVSGVGTVYVPSDSNVGAMQLLAKRRFTLRDWTSSASEESIFLANWNGSNGIYSIRDHFFEAQSTSGIQGRNGNPNNFRPYWYNATTTSYTTALPAVTAQVDLALAGQQRTVYQAIASAFGNPTDTTGIRTGAANLGVTAKLLDAYVSLALPESFASSDILRGPLRGVGEGIDAVNAQRLYLDAISALPTTLGTPAPTVETRIDTAFGARRTMLQRELNAALSTSRPAESYPFMKWTLAGLSNLRDHGLRLAADDTYITGPGTPLVVSAADGLLSNDAEQPDASVTAVLVSPPSSGTLTLNADGRGGFRYTPASGFSGTTTFTYKARGELVPGSGNTVDSLPATVVIRVEPCLASIVEQPQGQPLTAGGTVTFGVAATAASRVVYQWRKDGVVLTETDRIIGSAGPYLTIMNVSAADAGSYAVALATDCGTVLSATATLGSAACSIADLGFGGNSPDGVVDGSDFVAFINSFAIGDVDIDPLADVNADGVIDGSDFVAFINGFALGC